MKRTATLCLLGGLVVMLGMTGEGCPRLPELPGLGRLPPAIIPTVPTEPSLRHTYTVDLRDYPETHRISWDFGDGAVAVDLPVATGRTVVHDFAEPGTFEVTVYLFSVPAQFTDGGARLLASGALPVDVVAPNVPPVAAFSIEGVLDEEGLPLPLTMRFSASRSRDPDGDIEEYRWDFGDGSHGKGVTVEHAYARGARFVVRLTVVDDRGGTDSVSQTLIANTTPVARFTFSRDAVDAMTFTFDASGSSDAEAAIAQYRWDFGDDSAQATGRVVSHTFAVPADYTVVLSVTDEDGTVASTSRVVDVTGTEPFVRSIAPALGEVGEQVADATIDGENFADGAAVRLEGPGGAIQGSSVAVLGPTTIRSTFDLTGATPGDYAVVVTNPGGVEARLTDGFRVVTPNLVRLNTSLGDVVLQLVDDAPVTTANFLQYVEDGFYDGTIFHRVATDFVVQGGGFLPGMIQQAGLRDPIVNEFDALRSNVRGTVAMAKLGSDPDSATSQFFVNISDNSANLDNQNGGFTVFATVIEGMDVVDAIAAVPLDGTQPIDDVLLIRAERE